MARNKYIKIIFPIICFFLFLELYAQAGAWINTHFQSWYGLLKTRNAAGFRILCVGESTTYDGGEESYPSLLEKELKSRRPDLSVSVINMGQAGINSQGIVQSMPQWIEQYKPDMVVMMIGINDSPDQQAAGWGEGQNRTGRGQWRIKSIPMLWQVTAKAWNMTKEKYTIKKAGHPAVSEPDSNNQPRDALLEEFMQTSPDYRNLYNIAVILEGKQEYNKAAGIYRKLASLNAGDALNVRMNDRLADVLYKKKDYIQLAQQVKIMLKKNPNDVWVAAKLSQFCKETTGLAYFPAVLKLLYDENNKEIRYIEHLGGCLTAQGKPDFGEALLEKARQQWDDVYNPVTMQNLVRLIELLSARNILPVFAQYPTRDVAVVKEFLRRKELVGSVTIVDNARIFNDAVKKEGYDAYFKDRCCGSFGHGTAKGNRLLAENIAEAIMYLLR